jgi:hypothetical protein
MTPLEVKTKKLRGRTPGTGTGRALLDYNDGWKSSRALMENGQYTDL